MDHAFSYANLKQIPGLRGHNRTAEIIALPLGAPVVLEELELRTGFDSLRNYPLPQASADIDHGADNSPVSRDRREFLLSIKTATPGTAWKDWPNASPPWQPAKGRPNTHPRTPVPPTPPA